MSINESVEKANAVRSPCLSPKCFEIPGPLFERLHEDMWNSRISGPDAVKPAINYGIPISIDGEAYFCDRRWAVDKLNAAL